MAADESKSPRTPRPPRPPVKIKRMGDLRSGVVRTGNGECFPHQTYMRLCSLEMERFRREQERAAALARADKCADRCRQIEVEVAELLQTVGKVALASPTLELPTPPPANAAMRPPTSGRLTLNY